MSRNALVAIATTLTLATASHAADPACAALIAATMPKPELPYRVRMTMKMDGKPTVMESVYINNTIYTRQAGEPTWNRTVIKDMKALATLAADTLSGCSAGGVELVGATPTRVWTTRSVDPFTKKPMTHKVWVGVADSRVYRQVVDDIEQIISYDNVVAPTELRKK